MPFRMCCDNKGCGKDQEPVLDVATQEVFCTECGKTIKSATYFTKVSMRTLGQIRRDEKKQQAFSVRCKFCQKDVHPKLVKNEVYCGTCDKHLDYIPKPYIQAIKTNLKAQKPGQ